jgi:phosphohistidine phosphatase
MKTLLLMRHAKSSWKDPKLADHERPLNKRGHKDAPFMGEILLEKELLPQKILASTAVRVRETVAGLVKGSQYSGETEFSDALYLSEPETYLTAMRSLPDSIERVMLIGHNPGLEGLLQQLSGRIESIETGSVAYLSLPLQSWSELTAETEGELIELLHLHDLRDEKEEGKKKDEKKHKGNKKEDEKKHKEEKAAVAKKDKEEKAAVAKHHKEEKAAAAKLQKDEKAAAAKLQKEEKAAAVKLNKEEKATAAKQHKIEKEAEQKKLKEEKVAAAKKHKEENEKKHKEDKQKHKK